MQSTEQCGGLQQKNGPRSLSIYKNHVEMVCGICSKRDIGEDVYVIGGESVYGLVL
jgi:hypothetical protein